MDLHARENPQPKTPASPLGLVVIIASNREGRLAPVIADWFLEHARAHGGYDVDVVDLAHADLPVALSNDPGPAGTEALERVTPRLAAADAFVVVTPEYNHSFPAGLKNLIDWHFTEWRAKPVAFVAYGGMSSGLRAVEQLRQVFAEMHAVTIRDTVAFHNVHTRFDEEGRPRDPAGSDTAAKAMLDQLAWWGETLREAKAVRPYDG
ncbi:NADPH-dependent FMN reductase [Streptomyces yaizuensis]|uniref:NAD(P)H-dependent oxidoreductase n=1 Tax=Streptomyces yaizuensis TaxID=2989713 RepID=A0ABQ5NUJ3_9ACTN|nr:NAD(P)H-dependent oxidoreductase [Streptomyces sp. YSPA8]GLF93818.1 NAD(P)H-dependent oxidoreductase [Streptomyces sp. YSPA8]